MSEKLTVRDIQAMRNRGETITMLTAYDYPTAAQINAAGIDMILVGDSAAMVVHGHPNTLTATMDMMVLALCGRFPRLHAHHGCSRYALWFLSIFSGRDDAQCRTLRARGRG